MLKVFVSIHKEETELQFYSDCGSSIFKPCWKFNFFYYIKSYSLEANKIGVLYPESFIHPKNYISLVEELLELSKTKTMLISTFSLDLVKEIEILKSEDSEVIYCGINNLGEIEENINFEYLEDLSILDVALQQNDRFLSKEE